MNDVRISIITRGGDLPPLEGAGLFHSAELFRLYERTPRHSPLMVVASRADGTVVARLLATVRWRWRLVPLYVYRQCLVMGEGCYAQEQNQDGRAALFARMLHALTRHLGHGVLYVEVLGLGARMFAYRDFRREGFFPVRWMSVANSLHSRPPEGWMDERLLAHVRRAHSRGVTTEVVASEADYADFIRLMRRHNRLRPRRYIPAEPFFRGLAASGAATLFVTRHHGRAIGCCACAYSEGDAYLWYVASLRKTYARLHPDAVTIHAAMTHAHARGCAHFRFMDVGLPFRRNPFRRFILGFGGKPAATFRWFRCSIGWLNRLLSWVYAD